METKGKEAENYISALQRKNKKRTYNDNKVTNIRKWLPQNGGNNI